MEPGAHVNLISDPKSFFYEELLPPLRQVFEAFTASTGISIALRLRTERLFETEEPTHSGAGLNMADGTHSRDNETCQEKFEVLGLGEFEIATLSPTEVPLNEVTLSLFRSLAKLAGLFLQGSFGDQLLTLNNLHEVMISLSAIDASVAYIEDKGPRLSFPDERVRQRLLRNLAAITDQMQLSMFMVRNLLDHLTADPSGGVAQPVMRPIEMVTEIKHAIEIWGRVAKQKGVEFKANLEGEFLVRGDLTQLRHLFNNLFSNAVKYSYATTRRSEARFISVSARRHDPGFREPRISINISNYGVGLLSEEEAHIGELGFRGKLARSEQPFGFGVGVFMARQIAKMHGGYLRYKWSYLHDNDRISSTEQTLKSSTYLVECRLVLPLINPKRRMA